MKTQLESQISQFIMPFIQLSSLSYSQFPILQTTYSLWRKVCYKTFRQKYKYQKKSKQQQNLKRVLFQTSERTLLPIFIQKIKRQMDGRSIGWRKAILEQQQLKKADLQQYRQLLVQYSEALYEQELWIQLFYDLVSIPYSEIYVQSKQFQINQKYKSQFYKKKNETLVNKACNKVGKNIISKGLGKISEVALSKWMVYGMTGVLGGINPFGLAASFSINYAMERFSTNSKLKQIIDELIFLKSETLKNVKQLQQIYEKCLCSIQAMLYLQESQNQLLEKYKKKLNQQLLSKVLNEDWLQIKITKQGEWQLVELHDKYSEEFQDLSGTEASSSANNFKK